jgi:hypothetical protein
MWKKQYGLRYLLKIEIIIIHILSVYCCCYRLAQVIQFSCPLAIHRIAILALE